MTSATGNQRVPGRTRGFSLIEILLVLGLIALAAGMIVTNAISLAERGDELPVDETLKAAVRTARLEAARKRQFAELSFNDETGQLEVRTRSGEPVRFDLGQDFGKNGRGEILFHLVPPARGMGKYPEPYDTSGIKTGRVRFAPDRSSQPFTASIDYGYGSPEVLAFDPFSSLVLTRP